MSNEVHETEHTRERRRRIEYGIAVLIEMVFFLLIYGMVKPVWDAIALMAVNKDTC
jgi:hypothetical protein